MAKDALLYASIIRAIMETHVQIKYNVKILGAWWVGIKYLKKRK